MLRVPENEEKLKKLSDTQNASWTKLEKELTSSMFLVDFFTGVQLT